MGRRFLPLCQKGCRKSDHLIRHKLRTRRYADTSSLVVATTPHFLFKFSSVLLYSLYLNLPDPDTSREPVRLFLFKLGPLVLHAAMAYGQRG